MIVRKQTTKKKAMQIFKKKATKKGSENQFIGGFIPPELSYYINLYSLATEMPKNTVITNCLRNWFDEISEEVPAEVLIELLTKDAVREFKKARSRKDFDYKKFETQVKVELQQRKLSPDHIKEILKAIQNEKNQK